VPRPGKLRSRQRRGNNLDLGSLIATFGVDSSQLQKLQGELNAVDRQSASTFGNMKGHASSAMSSMAGLVGVTLSVAGAFYAVQKAVRFSIQAQEEFRLKTIEIGSGLTNLAQEGQGSFEKMFKQNFKYAQAMYDEIRKEDAKRFASAADLMTGYNALVQKGYAVRLDEVDSLGVLVDKIKLATAGQNTQMQINQEIRGLLDGQVRAGSLLGMELQSRLGPAWKDQVTQHRKAGDLLAWLASMWPGIAAACAEVENTLEAQTTTLEGNLKSIGRQGALGIYELSVGVLKDMNKYLREHEQDIVVGLVKGWTTLTYRLNQTKDAISWIIDHTPLKVFPEGGAYGTTAEAIPIPQRSFAQQTMVNFKDAFWTAIDPGTYMDTFAEAYAWLAKINNMLSQPYLWKIEIHPDLVWVWDQVTKIYNLVSNFVEWEIRVLGLDTAWEYVLKIYDIVSKPITWSINAVVSGLPSLFPKTSAEPTPEAKVTRPDTSLAEAQRQAVLNAKGMMEIGLPTQGIVQVRKDVAELVKLNEKTNKLEWDLSGMDQTQAKPPGSGKEKKDKGSSAREAAEKSVRSFIETMAQATAQGAGDTEAILAAWKSKQLQTLNELAAKGADVAGARAALDDAYASKRRKLDDDFNKWYISGLGNQQAVLKAEEDEKLKTVAGNESKMAQVKEVYRKKNADLDYQVQTNTANLFKGYLDTMAGLAPTLEGQLRLKRESLDLELKLSKAALERQIAEKQINPELADQARAMEAMVAQAKKYNLEMENNKGLQGWAHGRVKADQQTNTVADMMEGAEGFITDVFTQGIQGALSKTKVDFMEVAKTMAQSLVLNLAKQGIHKAFGSLAELIAGAGAGKLGTDSNPMVVKIKGMGSPGIGKTVGASFDRSAQKAEKIGFTMGADQSWDDQSKQLKTYEKLMDKMYKGQSKDLGGIQRLQERFLKDDLKDLNAYGQMQKKLTDQNQELFKAEYLTDYENSFTGMATGITSIWTLSQGIMTAAGVKGEAARYGTMVSYGMQGISLIADLVAKGTLMKAAEAGAAAYSSTWEALGFPLAIVAAPLMAAVAFAGTMAAGAIKSSAGGDWSVAATGPRVVHQEETVLPAWAAQGWRDIVSRESSGGKGSGGGLSIGKIHIDARGASKDIDWNHVADRIIIPKIDKALGRRGYQKIGGGR